MPHCIYQLSQCKTTGIRFGLWNLWYFSVCHVIGFLPEVYNLWQVQYACPLVTILVFVSSNIDQSLQKYYFLVLFLACLPTWIDQYFTPISAMLFFITLFLSLFFFLFKYVPFGSVDLQFAQCSRQILLCQWFDSETLYDFWYKNKTQDQEVTFCFKRTGHWWVRYLTG